MIGFMRDVVLLCLFGLAQFVAQLALVMSIVLLMSLNVFVKINK